MDQIIISDGTFSSGGDSGSLIVTDDGSANPVGLLFAGSPVDTIANPIDTVLTELGAVASLTLTIDGATAAATQRRRL